MDSATSKELPIVLPMGWSISVISAVHFTPKPSAVFTSVVASCLAIDNDEANAARPHFTSKTSADNDSK